MRVWRNMTDTTDRPSDSPGFGAPDDGSPYEHPFEPSSEGVRAEGSSLDTEHNYNGSEPAPFAPGAWYSLRSAEPVDEPASEATPGGFIAHESTGVEPGSGADAQEDGALDDSSAFPLFEFPASTDFMGDPLAPFAAPFDSDILDGDAGATERPEPLPATVPATVPAAVPAAPAGTFFQADTSADLLRWRAEQLLDEMMIGAVDASAGETSAEPPGDSPYFPAATVGALPAFEASGHPTPANSHLPAAPRVERLNGAPHVPQAGPAAAPPLPSSTGYPAPGADGNGGAAAGPRLVSVEQRYAPYVRTASPPAPSAPSGPPARPQVTAAANGAAGHYANGSNGSSGSNGHSANGHAGNGQHAGAAAPDQAIPPIPQLGPVRRSAVVMTGSVAGAMNAGSTRSKYTSLLPRSAPWDAREMEREIGQLSAVIDRHLPSGYESSRRARYLLDKAAGILADDPDRSAEVDYYLGQVRAIVERVRQAVVWSNVYRRRLSLYLVGWVVLSAAYLAAGLLYGSQLAEWFVGLFRLDPEGLLANHLVAAFFAGYAGSLGAAAGILAGLGRVGLKHSLVDRKFGLRGLVLPFIGFLAGLLLYALLGGLFWLTGVPPALLDWLTLLPALLAFLFGLFQEALYGVRD